MHYIGSNLKVLACKLAYSRHMLGCQPSVQLYLVIFLKIALKNAIFHQLNLQAISAT